MPTYRITSPDGKTFDVTGTGTADEALAHIQQTYNPAPVGTQQTGSAEALANFGTGMAATPIAGLAGLASMGTKALGLTKAEPADVVRNVQSALTYEPRTQQGQAQSDVLTYPFRKLGQLADYAGGKTTDATGSPLAGTAVNTAIQALPAVLARGRVRNGGSSVDRPNLGVAAGEAEKAAPVAQEAGRQPGLAGVPEKPPTLDELKNQARDAYKRADEAGVKISGDAIAGLKTQVVTDLKKVGMNRTLHPDASAALDDILASKGDISLTDLETLRSVASDAKGSVKPADSMRAGKIVDHIDNFLENLKQGDVTAGDPAAVSALSEARSLYSRQKKAETIQELMDRAGTRAGQFSGSGYENALRTEFRQLALNKNRMRRFAPEEQAAIKKVAMGGPLENAARMVGKLAPTGVVSAGAGAALGAAVGGPVGAAVVPAIGYAARGVATRLTQRNALAAEELMRRGPQKNALKTKPKNALTTP